MQKPRPGSQCTCRLPTGLLVRLVVLPCVRRSLNFFLPILQGPIFSKGISLNGLSPVTLPRVQGAVLGRMAEWASAPLQRNS